MTQTWFRGGSCRYLLVGALLLTSLGAFGACSEGDSENADDDGGAGGGEGGSPPQKPSEGGSKGEVIGGAPGVAGAAGASGDRVVDVNGLRIEPNPRNSLSAYVTWRTDERSSSIVQFGERELTWQIEGKPDVKEHRVLLIGMRPETVYRVRAFSEGDAVEFDQTVQFASGALPAHIPVGDVTVRKPSKAQPGWTLMNVQAGSGATFAVSVAPPTAVAYDDEGYPVWYYVHGKGTELGGAISVDPTDQGVLMGPSLPPFVSEVAFPPVEVDWSGRKLWTCEDTRCGQPDQLSHHASKLSNGNYMVMRDAGTFPGIINQIFYEYSPESDEPVHQIGIEDAMEPPEEARGDWAHGNSITVDLDQDVAYLSFRWLGLIKMTYSTREPLWHMPAKYGQETLGLDFGDVEFVPPSSQFSDIHDPEIHDDGTILFFDNGGFTNTFSIPEGNPEDRQSRAVEYKIEESGNKVTARLVWEWPGDFDVDPWYTTELYVPFWGDADRLENGNVLITAGRRGTEETPQSTIIEVAKDTGEVVWEMKLPDDNGVYRSERFMPPQLQAIE